MSGIAISGQSNPTIQSSQRLQEHREAQAKEKAEQPKAAASGGKEDEGGPSVHINGNNDGMGIKVDTRV